MQRARISRITSIVASAALVLGILPALASAAVPLASATTVALTPFYSAGNDVGFLGTYQYQDSSTLPRLDLDVSLVGATVTTYVSATVNGAVVGACEPAGSPLPVDCTFGQVRTNDVIEVVVGATPSDPAGTVTATYAWSTVGNTPSDGPGQSRGDTWRAAAAASFLDDPNFAGGFNEGTIQTSLLVSKSNRQGARLASLPAAVPASVRDNVAETADGGLFDCDQTLADCLALIGDWVQVDVGGGQTFGSVFTIEVVYYQGTPKFFVHRYVDGDGNIVQETVGPCPKKDPVSGAPCFTWKANTSTATIYTYQNAGFRG